MNQEIVSEFLNRVREKNPLVHNITNIVVANFSANGLLALGASPFMASAEEEVADTARISDAVVLNMGTLDKFTLNAMGIAGQSANAHGKPLVLDPVGVGATPYRTSAVHSLLEKVQVNVIRGNAGEISRLAGVQGEVKGVDAGNINGDPAEWVKLVAERYNAVVIATGKDDFISDGSRTFVVHNGHEILTKVTGTGCLLSAVVGAFAAVEEDFLNAAVSALTFYGVAAEIAAKNCDEKGPGSFQIEFLNQLSKVSSNEIKKYSAFEQLN
jgi:hydroxyethylthiazole kinase